MMNKTDLIGEVARKADFTRSTAKVAVEAVLDVITEALSEGDTVQLIGFGTFEVRDRAERQGKNPATGESMLIPARKVPAFKPGSVLKSAVND